MQLGLRLRLIWVLSDRGGGGGWEEALARNSNNSLFYLLTFWSFFIKQFVCTVLLKLLQSYYLTAICRRSNVT